MNLFSSRWKSINIIPGKASFSNDLRAQTNEVMDQLTENVNRIANMLATYHDVDIQQFLLLTISFYVY